MGSVNIMGNTDSLNIIRGKDKIKSVRPSFRCMPINILMRTS